MHFRRLRDCRGQHFHLTLEMSATIGGGPVSRLEMASAFWPLTTVTTVNDVSGNVLNLTASGTPEYGGDGPSGAINTAAVFSAGDWSLARASAVVTSGAISFTAWIRPQSGSELMNVMQQTATASSAIGAGTDFATAGTFGVGASSGGLGGDDAWGHVVLTNTGTLQVLYWNGTLVDSDAVGVAYAGASGILLGAAGVYGALAGQLALVGIYPFDLTQAEVTELYNGGTGLNPYA